MQQLWFIMCDRAPYMKMTWGTNLMQQLWFIMCDRASYMKMTRGTNLMQQLWFIMCDRASYMKMTRGTNLMQQLWFTIINNSTYFGHLYVHLQECRLCATACGVQHCKRCSSTQPALEKVKLLLAWSKRMKRSDSKTSVEETFWKWRDTFEVFVTLNFKICVFWDVKPYSLVEMYQRFGGTGCLSPAVSL